MVSSQNVDFLWVLDLVCEQQANGFDALSAPVDVISEEKIIGLGRESSVFEETEHVVVLTVDVPAYLEGRLDLDQHWLIHEYVFYGPYYSKND